MKWVYLDSIFCNMAWEVWVKIFMKRPQMDLKWGVSRGEKTVARGIAMVI